MVCFEDDAFDVNGFPLNRKDESLWTRSAERIFFGWAFSFDVGLVG
jgi:hypothetical protein